MKTAYAMALLLVAPFATEAASSHSLLFTPAGLKPFESVLAMARVQLKCSGISGIKVTSQQFHSEPNHGQRATEEFLLEGCGREVSLSVGLRVSDAGEIQLFTIRPLR